MDPERIIVMELETLSLEFLIISFFFRFDVPRLRDFFTTLRTINIPSFLFFSKIPFSKIKWKSMIKQDSRLYKF